MRLAPGRLLVKAVETAETLPGGLIVLTPAVRDAWTVGQAEVLAVGPPASCRDEDCERPHVNGCHPHDPRMVVGAWVLCKPRKFVDTDEGFVIMQDDVVAVFTAPTE